MIKPFTITEEIGALSEDSMNPEQSKSPKLVERPVNSDMVLSRNGTMAELRKENLYGIVTQLWSFGG